MDSAQSFSDFPWQTEVIAIADVGIYWSWWKLSKSDCDPEEESTYVESPPRRDNGTAKYYAPTLPFILGSGTSDKEISKLQKQISRMVDGQGWERHDPRTGEQGPNLDEYWEFIRGLEESGGGVGGGSGNGGRDRSDGGAGRAEEKGVVMIDDEDDEMVVEGRIGSEDDVEESDDDDGDQGGSDYEPCGSGGNGWD